MRKRYMPDIPERYWIYCHNPKIENELCEFYMHKHCPDSCFAAVRIKKGIKHGSRTGLERFIDRYGENWREIGVGSIMEAPGKR